MILFWASGSLSLRQWAAAGLMVLKWPLRWTRMTASHSSSDMVTSMRSRSELSEWETTGSCWAMMAAASVPLNEASRETRKLPSPARSSRDANATRRKKAVPGENSPHASRR